MSRRRRRELTQRLAAPLQRLTARGRGVLSAGLAATGCALLLGQRDLLRIGVLLALVPLITIVVLGRSRYRLACSRTVTPVRVSVGETAKVVLEVSNASTSRCGLVLAEEQVPFGLGARPRFVLPGLEPGERRAISYPVRSDLRGRFAVGPLSLTLTDPFGMAEHRRSFTSRDVLVVTPPVVALPPVSLTGDWTGSGDTRPRALSGGGEDDVTTREYRQGDDLRRVHWRSTARRGELMVRREEQPWQSRATLVLDRRRAAYHGQGATSSFEWAVSAVASVAAHLVERGYAVRLVDGSGDIQHAATPWAHDAHDRGDVAASAVLDALATVEPAGSLELQRAVRAASHAATGGLVVAVLGRIDESDATLLAPLNQPGTSCLALLAPPPDPRWSPPGTAHSTGDAAAARLRAAGWDVVPCAPGETLDTTWARVGAGRTLTTGGRR
jgi:uncharacterized protein (DUF58 family)